MATSGNFVTSNSGQGSAQYYSRMIFEWWETGSGISGSVGYHNISYHLKSYDGQSGYWQYFYNGSMNVDGSGYSWGKTQVWGAGATVFGNYGKTMYTDSAGNRSFSASAQGGVFNNTINTTGSGSWNLDNIPLHSNITGATGNIDDEVSYVYMTYNNPAGGAIDVYLDLPSLGTGGFNHVFNYPPGNHVSMAPDISAIRTAMVNVNSTDVRYVVHDAIGGADNWTWIDATLTIKNDTGQANPTFSTFTFKDNNSTTSAITGNDQYLIQGNSDLLVTVSTANKATPNKNATMDHYTVNVGGYSNNVAYSSGSNVTQDVGTVSDVTGARNLAVLAVDSRGNKTTVNNTVNILPYKAPVVNSTVTRANGFDDAVILHAAGSVSPLTISSVDKNVVNSTTGMQYRYIADGGDITGVSWTNIANTQTSHTGAVVNNANITIAASGTASSQHSFTVQVKIIDALNTTIQTIALPVGTPIFRIGTDGKVYFNEVAYQSNTSVTSASTLAPVGSASLNYLNVSALATSATISAPSGTLTNGNRLICHFKDNGTGQGLTWNAAFRAIRLGIPTATVSGKNLYVGAVYNATDSFWDVVAVEQEV